MFRSRDINYPMIYQISDVMMSISTWEGVNPLTHQAWLIDRYKQGHHFFEIF